MRFAWDSNYDGIRFPPTKTVVLTVEGPERARYWRASTLDLFTDDHWFEDLLWLGRVDGDRDAMPLDRLTPRRALDEENWLEQRIRGARRSSTTISPRRARRSRSTLGASGPSSASRAASSGVRSPLARGQRYRVWSYAPDPAPAALAASDAALSRLRRARYLELDGSGPARLRGAPSRDAAVRELLGQIRRTTSFAAYTALYDDRCAASPRDARRPYAAVLALENRGSGNAAASGTTSRRPKSPGRRSSPS